MDKGKEGSSDNRLTYLQLTHQVTKYYTAQFISPKLKLQFLKLFSQIISPKLKLQFLKLY